MGVVDGLLRVTLLTIHSVIWLRESISRVLTWLWNSIPHFIKHKGTKLECIVSDIKSLSKVPKHLTIIVLEEGTWYDDLARVTTWAFASGVGTVSLYDPCGKILRGMVPFRKRLHHHHQQLFNPPLPEVEVCTSQEATALSLSQNHRNGPYRVVVMSEGDGHQGIVGVAAEVCQAVLEKDARVEQVDTPTITNRISKSLGVPPDSEMALVFGSVCSTVGFPPWQLRLTELHVLPTHHKLSYQNFLEVLQKYASCQQRHGK